LNEHPSTLTQRVRKLLGTGPLAGERPDQPAAPERQASDSGALFESHISRLSSALRELRAIDRQREAELRSLRERLAIVEELHRLTTAERLTPALRRVDALIEEAARLLQPAPEPPAAATPFERMRARAAARNTDAALRAALVTWAVALMDVRAQLAALADE
jgi:hypothetical protein